MTPRVEAHAALMRERELRERDSRRRAKRKPEHETAAAKRKWIRKHSRWPTRAERAAERREYRVWRWQRDNEIRENAKRNARQWALDHPRQAKRLAKAASARRRARLKNAPGNYKSYHLEIKMKEQGGKCANPYCRVVLAVFHADHVIPLARGGSNHATNIQLLCSTCNLRKGAKTMEEFLKMYRREVRFARGY